MANEVASSDLADPFANCSLLSLFPRTIGASADYHHHASSKETDTIDSRHTLLKSLALRSPQKLVNQAKMVLNSKLPELPQRNISIDGGDTAAAEENVRRRRPGLGIKRDRPRFSFAPTLSHDPVRSGTTDLEKRAVEIENMDDPEEYFLAHKRLQIAKKEYERLGGDVLTVSKQSLLPTAPLPRQRRPGIFGYRRTTGSFKQLYSQVRSENEEAFISSQEIASQEILSQDVPSPSSNTSQKENIISDGVSFEREISCSVSRMENNINKLLNEFLSKNPEELEGDKAITLLQECLQIKPISTDKRCFPDLHDLPNDFKVSGGNLFNPRNSIVNAHAKLKGLSIQTPLKQRGNTECDADFIASPTPPRSALDAICSLKRRVSELSHSKDTFSYHATMLSPVRNPTLVGTMHIQSDKVEVEKIISPNLESQLSPSVDPALDISKDISLARNPSPVRSIHLQSDKVKVKNFKTSSDLESQLQAYDSIDCTTGSGEVLADYSTFPVDNYVNEYSSSSGAGNNDHSSGNGGLIDANPGSTNGDEMIIDDETRGRATHLKEVTETPSKVDNSAGGMLEEPVAPAQPVIPSEHPISEHLSNSMEKPDQQNPGSVSKKAKSKKSDANPEQPIENIQELPVIDQSLTCSPQNMDVPSEPATRSNKGRKRKEITRRQSLAAAGTKWESGVRRSTRFRMRPLEHWRGERFLYGRIHSSLATVIGVKYSSPATSKEKRVLKVKSFVSDQYKDLVDLAALH